MNTVTFESKLLPDGHLYCPSKFAQKKNAMFKVIVIFDENEIGVSEHDLDISAINDNSTDFLSKEELNYYFNLEEL
ncbi:MAG: hypothetical protein HQK77_01560 [Desulfobacterales bacterium]|nr:hypothetical protein [Desulfobacterales bacterium]